MRPKHSWAYQATLAAIVAIGVAWGAHAEESPASMHARISVELGGAVVKGDADDDWSFATVNTLILPGDTFWVEKEGIAEVEFSGGSFLRLADNSKTQINRIYPSPSVEGWTGSFYVHRLNRSLGNFVFKTPAGSVDIANDSLVRIDVIGEGATTVSVRFGHADVYAPNGERVRAHQGQRIFMDPGLLPSEPVPFDLAEEDDFDAWNRERVRLIVVGDEPVQSIPRTKSTPIGYNDLAAHGDWVYVDNRQYWRPTSVVDYVPYRHGYWSYVPAYGHVWIGHHPFSYVTSHYGRWIHHHHHGWLWNYDPVWGPAWVASYRYGDRYFWSPLDPYGHPVHYGHATFHIGDFVISVGATSYAYAHGHHGYSSVYSCYNNFFDDIRIGVHYNNGHYSHNIPSHYLGASGIHAWNIFAGELVRNYRPNLGSGVLFRDYTPRRVIRGLNNGTRGGTAIARARGLERTSGVTSFAQVGPRSVRGGQAIRTAGAASTRSARSRTAALPQTAIRDTREAIARTERNRGVTSTAAARTTRNRANTVASSSDRNSRATGTTRSTTRTATTNRSRFSGASTPRATTRNATTNRSQFSNSSTPRTTPRSVDSTRSTRSAESVRTPTRTPSTRTTASTRPKPTRNVTLPQRSGGDRVTTTRSTRGSSSPRVSTTPRTTNTRTSPRATETTRSSVPSRLSSPTVRTPRTTTRTTPTAPRVTTAPPVRTPSASTTPRVVSTPRVTQSPRSNTPRVNTTTRPPAPRVSTPTRSPAPRVSVPTRSPAPRVSTPTRSPAPRVSAPTRSSAPRVSTPTRSPAPRVSVPTRSSAPRVSAPSRSSAPRVSAPSRSSTSRISAPSGRSSSGSSSFRGRSPRSR